MIFLFSISSCHVGEKVFDGKFVVENYDYVPFITDLPFFADELELFSDGTFKSSYWGTGDYEIESSQITLDYKKRGSIRGSARFSLRYEMGRVEEIILFDLEGHVYKRIE